LKSIRVLILLLVLMLSAPGLLRAQGQGEALRVLAALEKKYAGLKDYVCDVKVHFAIETFRAPDLQARLFYKVPDKMRIESKRVVFFPRDGGYFNPAQFKQEEYTVLPLGYVTYDKRKAVQLRLIPKKIKGATQDMVLTIDIGKLLLKELILSQTGGKQVKAEFTYGTFASFELPTFTRLLLDLPAAEPGMAEGFNGLPPDTDEPKRITGEIAITYADYQVNTGLGDELFKGSKSPKKP
jgi:outer membrane lipoprotein-sorting protein